MLFQVKLVLAVNGSLIVPIIPSEKTYAYTWSREIGLIQNLLSSAAKNTKIPLPRLTYRTQNRNRKKNISRQEQNTNIYLKEVGQGLRILKSLEKFFLNPCQSSPSLFDVFS